MPDRLMRASARWQKSTFSGTTGCVEVRKTQGIVQVRDSKNPSGPVLCFSDSEWVAFLAGIVADEFSVRSIRRHPLSR